VIESRDSRAEVTRVPMRRKGVE